MNELYDIDVRTILGKGTFSVVYGGSSKSQPQQQHNQEHNQQQQQQKQQRVAIKCIPKAKLTALYDIQSLHDEVAILQRLNHSKILTLYAYFNERHFHYLITERIDGGELFDRIIQRTVYTEASARDLLRNLVLALEYLHDVEQVAHRDVKPENLILVSRDCDSQVKLVDFGFAKGCVDDLRDGRGDLRTYCGTAAYVAPEVLNREMYGTRADMWSVGVTLYVLLGGYPPFKNDEKRILFKQIQNADFKFHKEFWDCVSDDAKSLISRLLTVDTSKRLTAKQVLQSTWMCRDERTLSEYDLSGLNLQSLKKYGAFQKVKAAVYSLIAINKLTSLVCPDLMIVCNPQTTLTSNI